MNELLKGKHEGVKSEMTEGKPHTPRVKAKGRNSSRSKGQEFHRPRRGQQLTELKATNRAGDGRTVIGFHHQAMLVTLEKKDLGPVV